MPAEKGVDGYQSDRPELQELQRILTLAAHRSRVGERTQVLVEGESRRGAGQHSGRDPYHRVVNFAPPTEVAAGTLLTLHIVEATPHSLIGETVPSTSESPDPPRRAVKGRAASADEQGRIALSPAGQAPAV